MPRAVIHFPVEEHLLKRAKRHLTSRDWRPGAKRFTYTYAWGQTDLDIDWADGEDGHTVLIIGCDRKELLEASFLLDTLRVVLDMADG